jgi:hypothetical protein
MFIFLYLDTVNFPQAQIRSINAFWLEVPLTTFITQYNTYRTYYGYERIT